jgi:hypothetical protein
MNYKVKDERKLLNSKENKLRNVLIEKWNQMFPLNFKLKWWDACAKRM